MMKLQRSKMKRKRVTYRAFANGTELDFDYLEDAIYWARRTLGQCDVFYRGSIDRVIQVPGGLELLVRVRRYVVKENGVVVRDVDLDRAWKEHHRN